MNQKETIELDYEVQERSAIIPVNSIFYSALDKIPGLAEHFMTCISSTFEKRLKTGKVLKDEDINAIQTSLARSVEDWDLGVKLSNALKKIHSHDVVAAASLDALETTATKIAVEIATYLRENYLDEEVPVNVKHEIEEYVVRCGLKKDIMIAFNKEIEENETKSAPSGERLLEQQRDFEKAFQRLQNQVDAQDAKMLHMVDKMSQLEISSYEADFRNSDKTLRLVLGSKEKVKNLTRDDMKAEAQKLVEKHLPDAYHKDISIITIPGKGGLWIKVEFPTEQQKFTFEKSVSEERKNSENPMEMPMTTRLGPKRFSKIDSLLRQQAHRKLQDDWDKATKTATKIQYLPLIERKTNIRVQHKYTPSFTVWVEFCEPQYRHRWMLVKMNDDDNNFEGFDFDQKIPCPITRAQAEIHPHLKERRKGKPGEDYDLIKRTTNPKKRGNEDRSKDSQKLSNKEKQKKRAEAESTAGQASPVLEAGRGRGRGSPTGNKK